MMVGWYHPLSGHECEQTQGDNEGQGSLACCSAWGCRVRPDSDTEQQQQYLMVTGSVAQIAVVVREGL